MKGLPESEKKPKEKPWYIQELGPDHPDNQTIHFTFRLLASDIDLSPRKHIRMKNGQVLFTIGISCKRFNYESAYHQLRKKIQEINPPGKRNWALLDTATITEKWQGEDIELPNKLSVRKLFAADAVIITALEPEQEQDSSDSINVAQDMLAAVNARIAALSDDKREEVLKRLEKLESVEGDFHESSDKDEPDRTDESSSASL